MATFLTVLVFLVCSMAQLGETEFERATVEAREKERMDRQKLLCTLPRAKSEQQFHAWMADKCVHEAKEWAEDGLLLAAAVADAPLKARLQQHFRAAAGMGAKMTSAAMVAAKEGADLAQQVFVPAPTYMDLGEEDAKLLEKARKAREALKKKEAADVSKSAWNNLK